MPFVFVNEDCVRGVRAERGPAWLMEARTERRVIVERSIVMR